jgi:hypothetical protein
MTEPDENLLEPLRGTQPSMPPTYDLQRAMRDARRNVSRRNLLIGSIAAAALVAGGTAVAVGRPEPVSAAVWAGPRGTVGTATDPATQLFSLGWAPLAPVIDVSTSEYGQRAQYMTIDGQGHYHVVAEVGVYARGAGWRSPLVSTDSTLYGAPGRTDPPQGEPGPLIGGHTSTWVSPSAVVWEWAPGAYAVAASTASDAAETVKRIVNGIQLGAAPVRAPFTAPRPPAALKLRETSVTRGPGTSYSVSLAFSDRADLSEPGSGAARMVRYDVIRDARRDNGGSHKIPAPTSTVDGHPAHLETRNGGDAVWLFDVNGFRVEVGAWDPTSQRLLGGTGSVLRTARQIKPVAHPDQPDSWVPALS